MHIILPNSFFLQHSCNILLIVVTILQAIIHHRLHDYEHLTNKVIIKNICKNMINSIIKNNYKTMEMDQCCTRININIDVNGLD